MVEIANILVNEMSVPGDVVNLVTVNTPVRPDYQLTGKAKDVIRHFNVYTTEDMVQVFGGDDFNYILPGLLKGVLLLTGDEAGPAGRTFDNAMNVKYDDQLEWNGEIDITLSKHGGYHEKNVRVWLPMVGDLLEENKVNANADE